MPHFTQHFHIAAMLLHDLVGKWSGQDRSPRSPLSCFSSYKTDQRYDPGHVAQSQAHYPPPSEPEPQGSFSGLTSFSSVLRAGPCSLPIASMALMNKFSNTSA